MAAGGRPSQLTTGGTGLPACPLFPGGRTMRPGGHYDVSVRVPYPTLPVIRATIAVGRVAMPGHDEFYVHFSGALNDRVKVLYLEPQQYTISVRLVLAV